MAQTNNLYDVVVIGGGPAGLTAGLYLARARYRVLILEKDDFGGQITITNEVVNYPGVGRTTGRALTQTMRQQAQDFGAEFLSAEATGLDVDGDIKTVHTSRGDLKAFGILIATGASPRKLGFEGEAEYAGRGVAYCATCDGEFFTRKEVLVVGGGFAAAEESVFLTKYASKVTVLVREPDFTCDAAVAAEAKNNPKIDVRYNVELKGVTAGQGGLREATILDRTTGETEAWKPADDGTFGVFVFAGYVPATQLVRGVVELDDHGYVVTHDYLETSVPGVYAAGDLRVKNLRQVVTAVSDGAVAATSIERYAADMQRKTGLRPQRPATAPASSGASKASAPSGNARETEGGFLTAEQREQLAGVFARMERPLILKAEPDSRPVSEDLRRMLMELVALTDKLTVEWTPPSDGPERPCVRVLQADGTDTGIAFHGVPGGHEFNSFVVGLYNAAGPGQSIDPALAEAIAAIDRPLDLQIVVALSCTMCPELVIAAQKIAASNPLVTAKVYDVNHFPELRERYKIMSVPCLIINKAKVAFGKKTLGQLLELLAEPEAGQTG